MKILKPKFWDKEERGIIALLLSPIAVFYSVLIYLKETFSNKKKFSIPIICVGNIYIGGTGKTPVSIKIYEILKKLNMKPVIIKKNYRNQIDEVRLIKKYCEIILCDKRDAGIKIAVENKFNIIILDDGFQDFGIKKNINIICFNSNQKIGNGLVIPAGPLRQNLRSLKNCDMILFNGTKDVNFEKKLREVNNKLDFIYYKYLSTELNPFVNRKLVAFAGIGNPNNFFKFLKENNLNVVKEISYPDHYSFSEKELDDLNQLKEKYKATLITTEKDYMRIDINYRQKINFVPIKIEFENKNFFENILKNKI